MAGSYDRSKLEESEVGQIQKFGRSEVSPLTEQERTNGSSSSIATPLPWMQQVPLPWRQQLPFPFLSWVVAS